MIKDSSGHWQRQDLYLEARQQRPDLLLLSGNEFDCGGYIRSGYDGLLLGGDAFNGIARRIIAAVHDERAAMLQKRMNDLMLRVYGCPKIECWPTWLKELLVQMGISSTHINLLEYPRTEYCAGRIRAAVAGEDGFSFAADLFGDDPGRVPRGALTTAIDCPWIILEPSGSGTLMREAGFTIDHEHNHCDEPWQEVHAAGSGRDENRAALDRACGAYNDM